MTDSSVFTEQPRDTSIRERAVAGAKRGLFIGIYFAILLPLTSLVLRSPEFVFLSHPFAGILKVLVAFALATSLLRVLQPRVHHLLAAVAVGILCTFIAWVGITTALVGSQPNAYLAALALGVLGGTVGGVIMWRGWYR